MTTCNGNWTPASTTTLAMDEDGDPMNESWNYRSIAGMLLYSSGNTRPDITFAVSQVARFTHAPKASRATAVKKILRYLSRTINQGLIITKSDQFLLAVYQMQTSQVYSTKIHLPLRQVLSQGQLISSSLQVVHSYGNHNYNQQLP